MSGKDPAMPFYINDWLSSPRVSCMTLEHQGAYLRLLCFAWASQAAAIPDDDAQLAVLSGMGEGWLKGGSQMVRDCFEPHPEKDGFLTNPKLWDLWKERLEWRVKSKIGGQKSGEARRKSRDKGHLRKVKGGSATERRVVEPPYEPKGNSSSASSSASSNLNPSLPSTEGNGNSFHRKSGQSGISGIDSNDLKDTRAVLTWLNANAAAMGIDATSEHVQREILAIAEYSLAGGKKPGGMFVKLLKDFASGKRPSISCEAEDRAKVRLAEWRRRQNGHVNATVAGLAATMTRTEGAA